MTVALASNFDLIAAVVRAQERAEKRLRLKEDEAFKSLSLIEEKYPWIKNPFHEDTKADNQAPPQTQQAQPPQQHHQERKLPPPQAMQQQQIPRGGMVRGPPPEMPSGGSGGDMQRAPCPYCGRQFALDRVDKHAAVCGENPAKKNNAAKRGKMNMAAKRISGVV